MGHRHQKAIDAVLDHAGALTLSRSLGSETAFVRGFAERLRDGTEDALEPADVVALHRAMLAWGMACAPLTERQDVRRSGSLAALARAIQVETGVDHLPDMTRTARCAPGPEDAAAWRTERPFWSPMGANGPGGVALLRRLAQVSLVANAAYGLMEGVDRSGVADLERRALTYHSNRLATRCAPPSDLQDLEDAIDDAATTVVTFEPVLIHERAVWLEEQSQAYAGTPEPGDWTFGDAFDAEDQAVANAAAMQIARISGCGLDAARDMIVARACGGFGGAPAIWSTPLLASAVTELGASMLMDPESDDMEDDSEMPATMRLLHTIASLDAIVGGFDAEDRVDVDVVASEAYHAMGVRLFTHRSDDESPDAMPRAVVAIAAEAIHEALETAIAMSHDIGEGDDDGD